MLVYGNLWFQAYMSSADVSIVVNRSLAAPVRRNSQPPKAITACRPWP